MAVTLGTQYPQKPGGFQSSERFAQSTATALRVLNNAVDISFLGMGTATAGHVHNLYALNATSTASGLRGDAIEGQLKMIMATATGRADVYVHGPTIGRLPAGIALDALPTATAYAAASATGSWVFTSANQMILLQFLNGRWNYRALIGATQATAT